MLRLIAAAPQAAIHRALSAVSGIGKIAIDPDNAAADHYLIEAERRPSLAADIVAALVGHGIAVSEVAEIPPDLERVFLELTRHPANEAPGEAREQASKEAA
jgi:ABC-2 type transport system ATP-binding protein